MIVIVMKKMMMRRIVMLMMMMMMIDDDDDDNKAWWCISGWSCYNHDTDALFLLSALSRKRRHADHSEV